MIGICPYQCKFVYVLSYNIVPCLRGHDSIVIPKEEPSTAAMFG